MNTRQQKFEFRAFLLLKERKPSLHYYLNYSWRKINSGLSQELKNVERIWIRLAGNHFTLTHTFIIRSMQDLLIHEIFTNILQTLLVETSLSIEYACNSLSMSQKKHLWGVTALGCPNKIYKLIYSLQLLLIKVDGGWMICSSRW